MVYEQKIDHNGAFPTANALSLDSVFVTAVVDSDAIVLGNVIGAISILYNSRMFQEYGVMTSDEMAEYYNGMDIVSKSVCEAVLDCINSNQGVQDAIRGIGGGSGGVGASGGANGSGAESIIPSSVDNQTNLIAGAGCDDDRLYAIAVGIVDNIFDTIATFYQVVELSTNALELAGALSDNAPSWITGAIASTIEISDWLNETAFEAFEAFDTVQKRIDLSCEVYCIMVDNGCKITYDDLASWAIGKAVVAVVGERLDSVLSGLAGTLSASDVGNTSIAVMFATLNIGARFGGIAGATSFMTSIRYYFNDNNPDYVFCDPCNPPCIILDFLASQQGFIAVLGAPNNTPRASYQASLGWTANSYNVSPVDARKEIRIINLALGGNYSSLVIKTQSSIQVSTGIFAWTVDDVGNVVESLVSVENQSIGIGETQRTLNFSAPTLPHTGYRVDLRTVSGSVFLGNVYITEFEFCP